MKEYTAGLLTVCGKYDSFRARTISFASKDFACTTIQPRPGLVLPGQGSMFIGEKGYMLLPHIADPQLLPAADFKDYEIPAQAGANHYHLWADACLGEGETTAGFDYAGPLTEVLLLGVIANRFPTQRLEFDAEKLAITNFSEADQLLRREYREGWEVSGL